MAQEGAGEAGLHFGISPGPWSQRGSEVYGAESGLWRDQPGLKSQLPLRCRTSESAVSLRLSGLLFPSALGGIPEADGDHAWHTADIGHYATSGSIVIALR